MLHGELEFLKVVLPEPLDEPNWVLVGTVGTIFMMRWAQANSHHRVKFKVFVGLLGQDVVGVQVVSPSADLTLAALADLTTPCR